MLDIRRAAVKAYRFRGRLRNLWLAFGAARSGLPRLALGTSPV